MKDELRFMNELFRIINGALRLDIDKVRNYTSFLADKLDEAGEKSSASRLRRLLDESDHKLRPVPFLNDDLVGIAPLAEEVGAKETQDLGGGTEPRERHRSLVTRKV